MRPIDADYFIEYLGLDAENSREINLGEIVTLEDFDRQPTIDAEPVRHAHWIPVKAMVGIDPVTMDFKIGDADRCSSCSTDFISVQTKYKYCPYCGAKMDGESEVQYENTTE